MIKAEKEAVRSAPPANPEREITKILGQLRRRLSDGRSRVSMAVRDEKKLLREVIKMKSEMKVYLVRAKECLTQGNESEARKFLARKSETQALLNEHLTEIERQKQAIALLKESLKELTGQLKSLEARRKLLRTKIRRTKALKARKVALEGDGQDTQMLLAEATARLEIEEELLLESAPEDELSMKFKALEAEPESQIESLEELQLLLEEAEKNIES